MDAELGGDGPGRGPGSEELERPCANCVTTTGRRYGVAISCGGRVVVRQNRNLDKLSDKLG